MARKSKSTKAQTKLHKSLGFTEVVLAGIGIILGAGVYALIGKAAGIAGTGLWLSFLIAAGVASLSALSYAELSSMFPKAGAEFVFAKNAFGDLIGFLAGWLVIIGGIIAASAVALGFGGYLFSLFGLNTVLGGFILLILVALLLFRGVKESAQAAIIGTLIEAGGLVIIVVLAIPFLGSIDYFSFLNGQEVSLDSLAPVFAGAALVFFAFIGFEEISRMAEETKNPHKTIPKAIVVAIVLTSFIYVLVSIAAISVLDPQILGESDAPLADVAAKAFGPEAHLILSIIALFATANTVLMLQFATSRIIYGMGGKSILSVVHKTNKTPWVAVLLTTVFAFVFVAFEDIKQIAFLTDFAILAAFVLINLSLIWLRIKKPNLKRPFRVPTILIPILGALTAGFVIFTMPMDVIIAGTGLTLFGLLLYVLFISENKLIKLNLRFRKGVRP